MLELEKESLKFVPKGPVDYKTTLFFVKKSRNFRQNYQKAPFDNSLAPNRRQGSI